MAHTARGKRWNTGTAPRASTAATDWSAGPVRRSGRALLRSLKVWDTLVQRVERQQLQAGLAVTHGRRVDAALRLGIRRNTFTRKAQELGLEGRVAGSTPSPARGDSLGVRTVSD